jgi:hypothetical protein
MIIVIVLIIPSRKVPYYLLITYYNNSVIVCTFLSLFKAICCGAKSNQLLSDANHFVSTLDTCLISTSAPAITLNNLYQGLAKYLLPECQHFEIRQGQGGF